ncbi:hypothetical protein [Desulfobacula toluolica]|uniref:Uncharacterized protein n=1 Tax=Desulfobacula toluolica (strain DSM 7467 / Tol2) TaxID=651182 RepID=K0NHZ5_DESTT|nr:hypothetical protein [Desulfobacula toluolica]CCK79438.1 uncharacterized protein TOL2_C12750 [Desulfobacula toluolica Tol2]
MAKTSGLKRTQVQGKKYDLPAEEVEIQKLVKKGLSLDAKLKKIKQELETVKKESISIAERRREGTTTVQLKAVSGSSTITFRETYVCDDQVEEISQEVGSLFDRFFTKKIDFKTSKDLKKFLEGEHAYGLKDPEPVKKLILTHVKKKTTKPNVKIVDMD